MKSGLKSVFIKLCLAGFCVLALTACGMFDSYQPPHIFGGNEVPDAYMNEPRDVTTALPHASDNAAWPRVGDVPNKPRDFTPPPLIDQTMSEMEKDRTMAEQKRNQVQNPPAPFYAPDLIR